MSSMKKLAMVLHFKIIFGFVILLAIPLRAVRGCTCGSVHENQEEEIQQSRFLMKMIIYNTLAV